MKNKGIIKYRAGVYRIKNLINEKSYIGSSVNIYNRYHAHKNKLKNKNHSCKHLENAYHKYGFSNFIFEVLEYCDKHQITCLEQKYLDEMFPEYNKRAIAQNNLGVSPSKEKRKKISNKLKKKYKNGEIKAYDQKHLWKEVEQYSLDGEYIQSFKNPTSADRYIKSRKGKVLRACKRLNKKYRGFQWKFKDDPIEIKKFKRISKRVRPISIENIETGEIKKYDSIAQCSMLANIPKGSLNKVLARNNDIYKNIYKIKYLAQNKPI